MLKDSNFFLSIAKIKSATKLRTALLHNYREINSGSNIDLSMSNSNYQIGEERGVEDIFEWIRKIKRQYCIRFRKNQILGIEILVSLPKLKMIKKCDQATYFQVCEDFIRDEFQCPILSSNVHNDESHEHAHFIIFPIRDGKMSGARVAGGPADFNKRRKRFKEMVVDQFFITNKEIKKSLKISPSKLLRNISEEKVTKEELLPFLTYFIKRDPDISARLLPDRSKNKKPKQ
jgi:hypothetical protein